MKNKKYVPNSRLPKGAIMLARVVRKKIGGWVEMEYDAKIKRLGLWWWRAKGGFGDHNNRSEYWCAQIPAGCLCVDNSDWDGSLPFGYDTKTLYRSFDAAVKGETKAFVEQAKQREQETLEKYETAAEARKIIEHAAARA